MTLEVKTFRNVLTPYSLTLSGPCQGNVVSSLERGVEAHTLRTERGRGGGGGRGVIFRSPPPKVQSITTYYASHKWAPTWPPL